MNPGIHGPPRTGTDRSESVRDFQNFSGPGPVRGPTGFGPWIPGWTGILRHFVKSWKQFASDLDDVITSDLFHSNFAKKTDELESSQRESDDIELEELPGVEDIPLYHVGRGLWGDIRYDC